MQIDKPAVLEAVTAVMRRRFEVTGERDKAFVVDGSVASPLSPAVTSPGNPTAENRQTLVADLYLPAPLHCIVLFDDATHCTRERAATFAEYPPDIPLNFDVRRYRADQAPGDPAVARRDVAFDVLSTQHGLNPTVRLRYDELAELPGSLEERVDSLLARRFAYHAGTTFHLMLETAGAKPHRTIGGR